VAWGRSLEIGPKVLSFKKLGALSKEKNRLSEHYPHQVRETWGARGAVRAYGRKGLNEPPQIEFSVSIVTWKKRVKWGSGKKK